MLRAYEKAGFQFLRVIPDLPDEFGPVWMLRIGRTDLIPDNA